MSNYPPPPPAASGQAQYEAPRPSGKAIAALVISIVGLFVCGPVGGIIALILAGQAKREIRESGGRITGEGQATAAKILGIIGICLGVVAVLAIVAVTFLGNTSEQKLEQLDDGVGSFILIHGPLIDVS